MKEKSSIQKTLQQGKSNAQLRPTAGAHGVTITPPAYGVAAHPIQLKDNLALGGGNATESMAPNHTGLPNGLKSGIESISGLGMNDVHVHYNSSKPAKLKAFAYTQGTEIHIAPGQERYLPHEAWHVVQQKQGRVQATVQAKGIGLNSDKKLEREADQMGQQAQKAGKENAALGLVDHQPVQRQSNPAPIIQMGTATDLNAAQLNRAYMVNEMALLNTSGANVYAAINTAPAGYLKKTAAAGLRYYWQTLIDGFDGKKAEMYEAEALANGGDIPILSTDDLTDPDVRTEAGGNVIATEVKTINSDNVANVNTLIKSADKQLAKRIANTRKIKIRIESRANLWPSAIHNTIGNISNNTALKAWLAQPGIIPNLNSADQIQIEGINVPYGGVGQTRNFWAEIKGTGDVKKTVSQVW